VVSQGLKVCIVFEGRDAPAAPADHRAGQPARIPGGRSAGPDRQREDPALFSTLYPASPAAGEIVIFDRSWYNRAGVERVMGLHRRRSGKIPRGAPLVERSMVESGIILLKYWLEVTPEEQERLAIASMTGAKSGNCRRWISSL
jgi:polyphosphate kinase 2 (PPK2 family)